jgi:hypothetical protein
MKMTTMLVYAALASAAVYLSHLQLRSAQTAATNETARKSHSIYTAARVMPPSIGSTLPAPPAASRTTPSSSSDMRTMLLHRLERALSSADPTVRDNALARLLPELTSHDPAAAARFAELQLEPNLREQLLRRVSQLWAAQTPEHAIAWAESLPDAGERHAVLIDIGAQLAIDDPAHAVALIELHASPVEPEFALENFTQQWAAKNFSAALAWASARPPGKQRDSLLERLAFIQSQTAPSDAARLVIEHIPEGEAQTTAIMTVVHQWATRDHAMATQWVDRFQEATWRQRALEELAAIAQAPR